MAADRPSRVRPKPRGIGHEPLESRRVLAPLVAVGTETGPTSAPWVRLMDAETGTVIAQVLAFEATFKGGTRVAMGDVDGDGAAEVIAGSGAGRVAEIRVFKPEVVGGSTVLTELTAFRTQPFGARYRSGIEVAVGDVDGNGRDDLVATMSRGNGVAKVFRSVNAADPIENTAFRTITAFGGRFGGGASVTVADLGTFTAGNLSSATVADGKMEIIIGSGPGMAPTVVAYDVSAATPRAIGVVRPFSARMQGGVLVTAGRYDADAIDEIVVSAGRGGGGATEVYALRANTAAATRLAVFSAFGGLARPNAPVFAAALDRNGDGRIDRFFTSQGDPNGSASLLAVSEAGTRLGAVTNLAGPLRIAAPRPTLTTLPSGLQYRVLVAGTGATPVNGQVIRAHYTGTLTDGTIFDSSRARGTPFEFTLGAGQVIAGWDEAFLTMKVGERRLLVIPPNLGYGSSPNGTIPANSTLVFDVELLEVRANSSASISGTSTGLLTEDGGVTTVGGTLTVTDADAGEAVFASPPSLTGTYGTFSFAPSTGVWGYSLDNAGTVTQALRGGQTVTDALAVASIDGTATSTIVVTIAGAWDAPTDISLSSSTVAENVVAGTVVGTLSSSDADGGDAFTYELVSGSGDADNAWFTIDGSSLRTTAAFDFEARSSGSIRVRSTDQGGLAIEKEFTFTVIDVNESATIGGTTTGSVTADGPTTTGSGLTVTDPDAGQSTFAVPASLNGEYGTFTFDAATGAWTYALDPARPATAMLTSSQTVTDTLTVTSIDGTASQVIEVSIAGFIMQSLSAVVATPSPSAGVPAGSSSTLQYRDVTVGSGDVATSGRVLTVNYIGQLVDGTLFDSSLLPGRSPLLFTLGVGEVIRGWDAGVDGMQVGGIRVLVIPAELAYGDAVVGSIPAGSTLVFYVELLSVS